SPRFIRVVVREGDSLWTISRRYHTSIARIEKLNPGLGHYLQPGQSLTIPANSLTDVRALPNPLLSQGRRIRYRVRQGDSLWRIANRFGTTPSAIARANQLPPDALIRPGDTLWVLARIRPS
ncbi:MAG: LysM peptidoglycan-binding domain-containing protein, partial [Mariprofundaceae bacterium]|nr:LysM peptidoglycan-binding domain-containing protein [Mariprofundaceae bacterium]